MTPATKLLRPSSLKHRRASILVIDDDYGFRRLLSRYLETRGFKVIAAKTGHQGLEFAKNRKFDLVFVDLCLGSGSRLSGNNTIRALKVEAATRDIPLIAISGIKESSGDEAQVRRDGADEFLTKAEITKKPPGQSAFLRRVESLLMLNRNEAIRAPAAAIGSVKTAETASTIPGAGPPIPKDRPGLTFTVLVIDDEEDTAVFLKTMFSEQPSYRILSANGGTQGLRMAASEFPDLIVLDLILPGISGQEVCRRLREQEKLFYVPILVLTADLRVKQEIKCINLGADDYMVKPFNPGRLTAKIRNLIRRQRLRGNSKGIIKIGAVSLDINTHHLAVADGTAVAFTPTESSLCALLMSAEGKLVDKKILFKKVYSSWPAPGSTTVRVHISHIREKLGCFGALVFSHKDQGYGFNIDYANHLSNT